MTPSLVQKTSIALLSALLLVPAQAFAQTTSTTSLIKGPGSTVYYEAQDGKRYVFPNESTYNSWYPDSTDIKTLTADQLAAIPLGGNMTYRPGSTLVKITTDPKVYAVSKHGILHWVSSEELAAQLFGADWNKKIVDVPDAFFINYTMGDAIQHSSDYNAEAESQNTPTPDDNMKTDAPTHVQAEDLSSKDATSSSMLPESHSGDSSSSDTTSSSMLPEVSDHVDSALSFSVTPQSVTVGSRASFSSDATNEGAITSHKILGLIAGNEKPVVWKDCGTLPICAASTPFYRSMTLVSQIVKNDETYVSASVPVTVSGDAPHPALAVSSYPTHNTVEITITAPSGEMIGTTALVDGTSLDDKTLSLCDGSCTVTIQVNVPGNLTAFTYVGGKYEKSNTIAVKPE